MKLDYLTIIGMLKGGDSDTIAAITGSIAEAANGVSKEIRAEAGDKLVGQNCSACELNFEEVCAGHSLRIDSSQDTYGISMEEADKMLPNGCDDYGVSLDAFIE